MVDLETNSVSAVENPFRSLSVFPKMTKEEYMETIFGPRLNIQNLTFSEKMKKILTSHYMHFVIIALVLLDSLCVTVELIGMFEDIQSESLEHLEYVIKYLGLSILSIFMVELILKVIFINKELLKSKFEIFDAVIVLISFIAELVFINHKDSIEALGGILALFRLWRVVRIVNGIIVTVEKRAEIKIEKINETLNALVKETQKTKSELRLKKELLDDIMIAYMI